jgi:tetratricopeptide (TPR) repeat protein
VSLRRPPEQPGRPGGLRRLAQAVGVTGLLALFGRILSAVLEEVLGNVLATWLGYGGPALLAVAGFVVKLVYDARRPEQPAGPEPPGAPLPEFAEPLGRDAAIEQVVELARERGNVLVYGPAGIGTSTVAGQAARRLVGDAEADRRTYVDLRGQSPGRAESSARVRTRVLAALGLPAALAGDAGAAGSQVAHKLGTDNRLLLLDNVASPDQISWLAARVPGAHVLAAGLPRAADLPGFADFAVGPLDPAAAVGVLYAAYPGPSTRIVAEVARLAPEQRALANWYLRNPSVAVRMGTWLASGPDVSIASLLEHLALDEEDTGSAIRYLLHQRINEGLSRDSRRLLRLLARAPVSELSVATMAKYAGWRPRRVRAALEELAPRSLVQRVRPTRYRIPEAVRAAGEPGRVGAGLRAELRLVAYYAGEAQQHARALTGAASGDQRAAAQAWFRLEDTALLELLQRDEPHGRSADLWTIADALDVWFDWEDRLDDRSDAATAMALVAQRRGDPVAEETALLRLVAVDELLGRNSDEHMRAARELRGRARSGPRHSRLHEHEGRRLMAAGDPVAAANEFRSAQRHRPGRDAVGRVIDLTNLGTALLDQGDPAGARQCADEALVIAQRVGDVAGQAHARELLGLVAAERRSYRLARDELERARPLYAEVNDTLGQARCLTHLATLRLADPSRTGVDLAEAQRALRESLALRDGHGSRFGIALTHLRLAEIAAARGEPTGLDRHRQAGLTALAGGEPGPEPPPAARLRRQLLALPAAAGDRG